MKLRPRLLGCLLLFHLTCGLGQEALLNNLSVDKSLETRGNPLVSSAPDQPHLGPVQMGLAFDTALQLCDNVNYSAFDPQRDEIISAGMTAAFTWPYSETSQLNLNAGLYYFWYLNHPQYDRFSVAPNSALAWNIGFPDGTISLFDQFSYTADIASQGALTGLGTFPRFDNTIGLRVTWLPRKWLFQIGYSHDNYFTDDAQFEYVNRASEYFFARAAWRAAESTQFGIEASGSITTYELPIQSNNQNVSVGPYADWQLTRAIHLALRGGPTLFHFLGTGSTQSSSSWLNSYYLGIECDHKLNDFLSHQLNVQRNVQPGLYAGSPYYEQLTATYSVSYQLTRRITLSGSVTYEHGQQPLQTTIPIAPGFEFVVTETEIYDRLGGGPAVYWKATDKLTLRLTYMYWLRQSNLPDRGYSQNNVTLGLTFAL